MLSPSTSSPSVGLPCGKPAPAIVPEGHAVPHDHLKIAARLLSAELYLTINGRYRV